MSNQVPLNTIPLGLGAGVTGFGNLPFGLNGQYLKSLGPDMPPEWDTPSGAGDMLKSIYDPDNISLDIYGKGINVGLYADISTVNVPAVVEIIQTNGYNVYGKGRAIYARAVTEPTHPGKVQSADGAWWSISVPTLNQYMLGAVGDGDGNGGGTDDTTAIQNTLLVASAIKASLILTPGIFLCDDTITVPAFISIKANDVLFDFKNLNTANSGFMFTNGGSLIGASLQGPFSGAIGANNAGIKCFGTNNYPAAPTFVTAPNVIGCNITNFAGYGVNIGYVNRGVIKNCVITVCGYAGVGGVSCNNTQVDFNIIDTINSTGISNWYGIFIDRQDGLSEISDPRSYNCSISFNIISNINWEGVDTHAGDGFRIIGNRIKDCGRSIAVIPSQITGGNPIAPHRCIVANNVCSQVNSTKELIIVAGAYNAGVVYERANGCMVFGNTLNGGGNSNDTSVGAIHCYATEQLIIQNNILHWSRRVGICINFSNIEISVSGNSYLDPYSSNGACACIRVLGSDNRGYIGGETFKFSDPSLSTYVADYSIYVDTDSGTDIKFGSCAFIGIAANRLSVDGAGLVACNLASLWEAEISVTVAITSAASFVTTPVTFNTRAPRAPFIAMPSLYGPYIGKTPTFNCNNYTATGFSLTVYAPEGTTFGANGNIIVRCKVSL